MPAPGGARTGKGVGSTWRALTWYVREVLGENDYEKYVAHLARVHPAREPMSRRDFEHARMRRLEAPGARCC